MVDRFLFFLFFFYDCCYIFCLSRNFSSLFCPAAAFCRLINVSRRILLTEKLSGLSGFIPYTVIRHLIWHKFLRFCTADHKSILLFHLRNLIIRKIFRDQFIHIRGFSLSSFLRIRCIIFPAKCCCKGNSRYLVIAASVFSFSFTFCPWLRCPLPLFFFFRANRSRLLPLFLSVLICFSALSPERSEQRFLCDENNTYNRQYDQNNISSYDSDQRTEQTDQTSACQSSGISVFTRLCIIRKQRCSRCIRIKYQFQNSCDEQKQHDRRCNLNIGMCIPLIRNEKCGQSKDYERQKICHKSE